MQCNNCGFSNPSGMNFCGRCATAILIACKQCQFESPADFKFCGRCGNDILTPNQRRSSDLPKPLTDNYFDSAERRQLTVLFCDVVGSSILSESVDPEELREIMQKYRAVSDAVVKKYNGHTAQYLGDGILAYFGYPKANEDDAERAVRAGIELIENIKSINQQLSSDHHIELNIRIGIHTGLVVVGNTLSDNQNSLALGTTPNIAARIQDFATPNTVIFSHNTYQLVKHQIECKQLGEQMFKGFSTPIRVYQALKPLDINRWQASCDHDNIMPLIGREQEAALLIDRFEQAVAGTGQAILLHGEAGIGKSRMTQFMRECIEDTPHQIIECWGTAHYQNSYLHCIIKVLRQLWGLNNISDPMLQLACIEKSVNALDTAPAESVPLLAELLGIDLTSSQYQICHLPPTKKKNQILDLLLAILTNVGSEHVTVMIAEDLHWIDSTTLELLGLIIDQVPTHKIFVLLTFRPEFQPPWQSRSHLTQISINRLTRKQSSKMLSWITRHKKLPAELFQQIIDKTDGIPFYVEELTNMAIHSNLLVEADDHYSLRNSIVPLQIPATLQDSLMARLDSLGPEKELAQISAIVGREFSQEVLQAVMKKQGISKHASLEGHLSNLVCSELLYQKGLSPKASYMFRHALVHEAAYQSLLIKTRRKYHVQIAQILTENYPNIVDQNPELLAHHYANGEDHITAIDYLIIAVDTALKRSAIVDAIIHLGTALQCIERINAPYEKKLTLELSIQVRLAKAYSMTRGYGDPSVEKCYTRAHDISMEISKSTQSFPMLMGMWEYYVVRAKLETATELANVMDTIANDDDSGLALVSKRIIGSTLFWKGQFSSAKTYLLQGIKNTEISANADSVISASQDSRVAGLSNLACLLWLTGYADQSLATADEAVLLAEKLNHPFSQTYAHLFRAVILHLRGDYLELAKEADVLLEISSQYNFLFWQTTALMMQAWSEFQTTSSSHSIVKFELALKQYEATGSRLALSYYQSMLADLYCMKKKYHEAVTLLDSAIKDTTSRGDLFFAPELMRMMAKAQHAINSDNTKTKAWLDKASSLATQQGANAIQLRIAISRHELLDSSLPTNTNVHIRSLLSQITEGQNSIDIITAKRISSSLENKDNQTNKSIH